MYITCGPGCGNYCDSTPFLCAAACVSGCFCPSPLGENSAGECVPCPGGGSFTGCKITMIMLYMLY